MPGYISITKAICLRKQFLALRPWDVTRIFCVFKVIIKWDNLKKKCEICTAACRNIISRARLQRHALLALQPVLRGMCLSLWAQSLLASCQKSVTGWRSPVWHHLFCVYCLEWTLQQTSVPTVPWSPGGNKFTHSERACKRPGIPVLRIISNQGWGAFFFNSTEAP